MWFPDLRRVRPLLDFMFCATTECFVSLKKERIRSGSILAVLIRPRHQGQRQQPNPIQAPPANSLTAAA